jgi:hypothetical protein
MGVKSALAALTAAIASLTTPVIMNAQPSSPLPDTSAIRCPLGRVAIVRGGDAEASEGGGFYAARKNGIHGALDLNGWAAHSRGEAR